MHLQPLCAFITAFALTGVALAAAPNISKINGSIAVDADQRYGDISNVNGSIRLDDNAVASQVSTVNGSITVGAAATAGSVSTVNGSIRIGAGGRVKGGISAVNGSITLADSADVAGSVTNVNGRIYLDAAHVGEGIETVSGSIEIGARSRVEGGILVKKPYCKGFMSWFTNCELDPVRVVIGPDAIVQGELEFEREVTLFVSTSAHIGPVEGAEVIRYSGVRPR